ncbi:hypothetical protein A9174_03780 [Mesorhizobium loti NZP2037]|nr:hypothetical protein A9174_03780 [Mesorhizobium loti NZP2037]
MVKSQWFFRSIAIPALKAGAAQVMPLFRGVDPISLQTALRQGIDVTPTDHHWYGDSLEKALEYGGDYPSLLIIDGSRTERTFCEIRVDEPASEHEAGRQLSGHEPIKSRDGSRLLYSRLPPSDKRRGSEYEFAYAHYIPGNASEALIGYIACAGV